MATDYATLSPDEHTTTGLPNTKLAMWLFLASECLLFGALITTYVLYRGASVTGPYPADVFDIPFTSVSSFVLLASSLTMVLSLVAAEKRDYARMRIWLLTTAFLGLTWGGRMPDDSAFPVEMVGLYWHFVDIVWIVIFAVVYLIPTPNPA
jgi:heme/copper-type cytochrome/quinol oxidase subunit 3